MEVENDYSFVLKQFLDDIRNNKAVLLVGAGVSMPPPSELPSGIRLKEIILENLFDHKPLSTYYKKIAGTEKYKNIIPEVLFSNLFFIIREKTFIPFQVLRLSVPNYIHQSISFLVSTFNVSVFTTNFDLLLNGNIGEGDNIFHLHGDLNNPETMTILLSQIGQRAKPLNHKEFKRISKQKNLYVFGYSGNDKDITDLINDTDIAAIYWMLRSNKDCWAKRNLEFLRADRLIPYIGDLNEFYHELMLNYPEFHYHHRSKQSKSDSFNKILHNFKDEVTLTEKYLMLVLVLIRVSNYSDAFNLCEDLLKQNIVNRYLRLRSVMFFAEIGRFVSKSTIEAHARLDEEIESLGDEVIDGEILNTKGILFLNDNEDTKAREHFFRAKNILEKHIDIGNDVDQRRAKTFLSQVYNNIGLSYYNQNKRRARSYFLRSLRMKKKIGHILGEGSTMANLAIVSYALDDIKGFKYWEKLSFRLIDKYQLYQRKVHLLKEIGVLMVESGNRSGGMKRLRNARDICASKLTGAHAEKEDLDKLIKSLTKSSSRRS